MFLLEAVFPDIALCFTILSVTSRFPVMGHGTRTLARCFGGPFEGAPRATVVHGNPQGGWYPPFLLKSHCFGEVKIMEIYCFCGFRLLGFEILTEVSLGFLFLITPCPIFFIDSQCSMMILGDQSPSLKIVGCCLSTVCIQRWIGLSSVDGRSHQQLLVMLHWDWWHSRYPLTCWPCPMFKNVISSSGVTQKWCVKITHLYLGVKSTIVAKSTTVAL